MDALAEKSIVQGLRAFSSSIRFKTHMDAAAVIAAALDSDPRLLYYLRGYSVGSDMSGYVLKPQYGDRSLPLTDIHAVRTKAECVSLMCRCAEEYRDTLVLVARNFVDVQGAIHMFHVQNAPFYANLTGYETATQSMGTAFTVYIVTYRYRIGKVKLQMMEQEVSREVARIAKLLFTPDMPPEVKIYLAHNYLASTVKYVCDRKNDLATGYTQSAYGAFMRHECVCQGFAEAFKRLMDAASVECRVVTGTVNGEEGGHAWNIVSLGKEDSYCHIDVTWDAQSGKPDYTYFGKSDRFFAGKRVWDRSLNPSCSGRYALFPEARRYVLSQKARLLARGIDKKVLDC